MRRDQKQTSGQIPQDEPDGHGARHGHANLNPSFPVDELPLHDDLIRINALHPGKPPTQYFFRPTKVQKQKSSATNAQLHETENRDPSPVETKDHTTNDASPPKSVAHVRFNNQRVLPLTISPRKSRPPQPVVQALDDSNDYQEHERPHSFNKFQNRSSSVEPCGQLKA